MITVIVERVRHDSGMRVALKFPSDEEIVNIIRTLPDATWDKRMSCWHIAESYDINAKIIKELIGVARIEFRSGKTRKLIEKVREIREKNSVGLVHKGNVSHLSGGFPSESDINDQKLSKTSLDDIERYRSWLNSHRYPLTTVRTYTSMMVTFLKFVSPKEVSECDADDLVRMVNEYVLARGLSYSFQNQLISSVKKFYKEICREVIDPGEFTRPRTRHKLPNVLSKEEVKKILTVPMNEKHRAILSIIYGCGLRRSEVIMLEPEDIDRNSSAVFGNCKFAHHFNIAHVDGCFPFQCRRGDFSVRRCVRKVRSGGEVRPLAEQHVVAIGPEKGTDTDHRLGRNRRFFGAA